MLLSNQGSISKASQTFLFILFFHILVYNISSDWNTISLNTPAFLPSLHFLFNVSVLPHRPFLNTFMLIWPNNSLKYDYNCNLTHPCCIPYTLFQFKSPVWIFNICLNVLFKFLQHWKYFPHLCAPHPHSHQTQIYSAHSSHSINNCFF